MGRLRLYTSVSLYLLVSPVSLLEEESRKHQFETPIDILDGPAERDIHALLHDDYIDGQGVEDDSDHLDEKGHSGVARARYRLEQHIARQGQQVVGRHDVDRSRAVGNECAVVGVDEQYPLGNDAEQGDEGQHDGVAHLDDAPHDRHHVVGPVGPHGVAHEGAGGSPEGIDRHEEQGRGAAYDVRDGQRQFAQMLHGYEEEEPGADGEEVENHAPYRHVEYLADECEALESEPRELVFLPVDAEEGVEYEVQRCRGFGQYRPQGGTGDAHLGSPEVTEYKDVVEHDVGHGHDDGVDHEHAGAGDGYEEGPEHDPYRGEYQSEDAVLHVVLAGLTHGRRRDEQVEQSRGPHQRGRHQHDREEYQKEGALSHDGAQSLIFRLAVAPGHEYLGPGAEAEGDHVEGQIEHTGQSRGSQLDLSHAPHESGVGDVDEVLNK